MRSCIRGMYPSKAARGGGEALLWLCAARNFSTIAAMQSHRNNLYRSAALLATVLAMAGCKQDSGSADKTGEPAAGAAKTQAGGEGAKPEDTQPAKTEVTLQLNWVPEPEFGGFYAAGKNGLYEKQGLSAKIVAGGAGVQTWKMVATGKVPFAIVSADEVIRARLQGAQIVALLAVYQTNPQALMVHEGSGVSSLAEIFTSGKIKKVAMDPGLPYTRFLEKTYGFSKVEVIKNSGNLTLFLQDPTLAQQSFIFSEPVSAKQQNVPVKAFSIAESGYNPYTAVLVTSDEYLKANRDVVERFVRASRQGWEEYLKSAAPVHEYMTTQGATMTIEAMNLAAELQMPYIVTDEVKQNYLGYMTEERWKALSEQLKDLGEIEQVPEDIASHFMNIAPQ